MVTVYSTICVFLELHTVHFRCKYIFKCNWICTPNHKITALGTHSGINIVRRIYKWVFDGGFTKKKIVYDLRNGFSIRCGHVCSKKAQIISLVKKPHFCVGIMIAAAGKEQRN